MMRTRLYRWLDAQLSAPYRNRPLLLGDDAHNHPDITPHTLGERETFHFTPPQHVQPLPAEYTNIVGSSRTFPAPSLLTVTHAAIRGRHGLVVTDDEAIVMAATLNHPPYVQQLSAGRVHYPQSWNQLWRQLTVTPHYGQLATLVTPFSDGYFHWMLEELPRLWLLQQYAPEVPVLIPPNPPRWMRDSLAAFGVTEFIEWDVTAATVEQLLVPAPLHGTGIPSPRALRQVSERLRAALLTDTVRDAAPDTPRIYISRQRDAARRVVNEEALLPLLRERGFVRYHLAELSLAEQIALFAQAEVVIGAHGAGFVNTMHSRDLTLIEWFEPSYINVCYYRLACGMGFDYGVLMGETRDRRQMHIAPQALTDLLDQMGI